MSPPHASQASPSAPRRRLVGRWALLAALLLVAAGAASVLGRRVEPIVYATARLERGLVAKHVDANGTVVARDSVQVGSEISGRVTRVAADFNATVEAGDLLAELASDIYRTRVAEAEAELQLARAQLDVARSKAEQAKAEQLGARMLLESAKAELARAAA